MTSTGVVVGVEMAGRECSTGGQRTLDAVDRGVKVKDVLRSILNVVVGVGVSAMLLGAIIATETTKRGEWLC